MRGWQRDGLRVFILGLWVSMVGGGGLAWGETGSAVTAPTALGRLLTTVRERMELDGARRKALIMERRTQDRAIRNDQARVERVAVQGVLVRSGGPPVVWLNGESPLMTSGDLPEGVSLTGQGVVGVRLPLSGRTVSLRVGQRFDGSLGQVVEGYEAEEPQGDRREKARKGGTVQATNGVTDRYALGTDGAALSGMIRDRDQFQNRLGGLRSAFGR
ncbi:MAG: hypothetical protein HQL89_01700 [Magnetococcales bacterium]|nr:hypothetical protein [Magnetococcales bacterium]